MALTQARMLVAARAREAWNGLRRDAGFGARAFGALAMLVALGVLGLPMAACFLLGSKLVAALATPAAEAPMLFLASVYASVAWVLGALSGLRTPPHFHPSLIAALPVAPTAHGLAELLLGALQPVALAGMACLFGLGLGALNGGGAVAAPAALLLTAQALLALLVAQGAARIALAATQGRPWMRVVPLLGLALIAGALVLAGFDGWETARALLLWLPSTQGVIALAEVMIGSPVTAGVRALAAAAVVVLLALAVARRLARDARRLPEGGAAGTLTLLSFAGPARAIASVFCAQVLRTRRGRLLALLPAFLTALFVAMVWVLRRDADLPGFVRQGLDALPGVAWFALVPPLIVVFNSDLWINQFGWDRRGITGLLLLPVEATAILRGKLLGISLIATWQIALALPPLLILHVPNGTELLAGLASAVVALFATVGVGHHLSLHRPRPVASDVAGASLPWSLTLVPPAMLGVVGALLGVADSIGRLLLPRSGLGGPLGVLVLGAIAAWVYLATLERAAVRLALARERLVVALAA